MYLLKNLGSFFGFKTPVNTIILWNVRQLRYFVIPAKAGIQAPLPLSIELLL